MGTGIERFDDRTSAEVCVREERIAGQTEVVSTRTDIVADDRRDDEACRPCFLQRRHDRAASCDGVDASGVRDEASAAVDDVGQRSPYVGRQVAGEAERLVALTILLQDGERQLGQRLAHEVVDSRFEHVGHGAETVAVEALASPDANGHDPVVAAPLGSGSGSAGSPSCVRTWSAD